MDLRVRTHSRFRNRFSRIAVAAAFVIAAPLLLVSNAQALANHDSLYVTTCDATNKTAVIATDDQGQSPVASLSWTAPMDTVLFTNKCSKEFSIQIWGATSQIGISATLGVSGMALVSLPAHPGAKELRLVAGSDTYATLPATYTGGSGGGAGSATSTAAVAPQPVAAQLSLGAAANSGFTCKDGSSVSGYVGQWLALPTDCTLPARSNAKLLGWSTSVDFPVAIAQRQVDKGWGAYELTNEAGQLTAVFIPAGHAALVSGGNTLHPIWSA